MDDDDLFTMFRWSRETLEDDEIIEKHREDYEKTQRRDSGKKRMIITAGDVFGRSLEVNAGVEEGRRRSSLLRRPSGTSFNTDAPGRGKTRRRESSVRQFFHRASWKFRNSSLKTDDDEKEYY